MKGIMSQPWKAQAIRENPEKEWQTRRLSGLKEINKEPDKWDSTWLLPSSTFRFEHNERLSIVDIKPRFQVGEIVYLKEACQLCENMDGSWNRDKAPIYKADISEQDLKAEECDWDWINPRGMPAWAARDHYKILARKAERLTLPLDAETLDAEGGERALEILSKIDGLWVIAYTLCYLKGYEG